MSWKNGVPELIDDYLIVDRIYRMRKIGHWRPELGWEINGRWLGKDAALCWRELPKIPSEIILAKFQCEV
jgi:hypothetical protein